MAFIAAIKTSALNWPHHRGTATAFPLAAFGLSAFFFSTLGAILFSGDTSAFLMLLACGTSGLIVLGFFFVRVLPPASSHGSYQAVPGNESGMEINDSQLLSRTSSDHPKPHQQSDADPGTSSTTPSSPGPKPQPSPDAPELPDSASPPATEESLADDTVDDAPVDEACSLISDASSLPGDVLVQSSVDMDQSHRIDIRGFRMLPIPRFWQLFCIMGILAGIGLMTIKWVACVLIGYYEYGYV